MGIPSINKKDLLIKYDIILHTYQQLIHKLGHIQIFKQYITIFPMHIQETKFQNAILCLTNLLLKVEQQSLQNIFSGVSLHKLLQNIDNFPNNQLNPDPKGYPQKMLNMICLLQEMHEYFKREDKILYTHDINLYNLSKHNSTKDLMRVFECVMAVFMASDKEYYIQKIMSMEEKLQQGLVGIVQNALQHRVKQREKDKQYIVDGENQYGLREIIQDIVNTTEQKAQSEQEISELRQQIWSLEEEFQNYKDNIENGIGRDQLFIKSNEELKEQILFIIKENQNVQHQNHVENKKLREKNNALTQQIYHLNNKIDSIDSLEEKFKVIEHQNKKYCRIIQEQTRQINALQKKVYQSIQKNVNMIGVSKKTSVVKEEDKEQKNTFNSQHQEEINYMEEELLTMRKNLKEVKIENSKLRKKIKAQVDEEIEKKNMEGLLEYVQTQKMKEIQMLLVSLYEMRNQNCRLQKLLHKV